RGPAMVVRCSVERVLAVSGVGATSQSAAITALYRALAADGVRRVHPARVFTNTRGDGRVASDAIGGAHLFVYKQTHCQRSVCKQQILKRPSLLTRRRRARMPAGKRS